MRLLAIVFLVAVGLCSVRAQPGLSSSSTGPPPPFRVCIIMAYNDKPDTELLMDIGLFTRAGGNTPLQRCQYNSNSNAPPAPQPAVLPGQPAPPSPPPPRTHAEEVKKVIDCLTPATCFTTNTVLLLDGHPDDTANFLVQYHLYVSSQDKDPAHYQGPKLVFMSDESAKMRHDGESTKDAAHFFESAAKLGYLTGEHDITWPLIDQTGEGIVVRYLDNKNAITERVAKTYEENVAQRITDWYNSETGIMDLDKLKLACAPVLKYMNEHADNLRLKIFKMAALLTNPSTECLQEFVELGAASAAGLRFNPAHSAHRK